jgi:hypothetical protein
VRVEINDLRDRTTGHNFWLSYLNRAEEPLSRIGIHLAIFAEPFLSLVLNGSKTVESRFSRNRCAPFGEIDDGDIILIKQVGGPICGLALAKRAWFYDLAAEPLDRIKHRHGASICADDTFWLSRIDATYATFIELSETITIEPLSCDKRDRRGWVALRTKQLAFAF